MGIFQHYKTSETIDISNCTIDNNVYLEENRENSQIFCIAQSRKLTLTNNNFSFNQYNNLISSTSETISISSCTFNNNIAPEQDSSNCKLLDFYDTPNLILSNNSFSYNKCCLFSSTNLDSIDISYCRFTQNSGYNEAHANGKLFYISNS